MGHREALKNIQNSYLHMHTELSNVRPLHIQLSSLINLRTQIEEISVDETTPAKLLGMSEIILSKVIIEIEDAKTRAQVLLQSYDQVNVIPKDETKLAEKLRSLNLTDNYFMEANSNFNLHKLINELISLAIREGLIQ